MADIETIEIKGGESASISVEASSSVSAVVSPQASYAMNIAAPSGTSVEVSVASPSVDISSTPSVVTTVSEKFNEIEVSAAIPAVGILRLRDLQDIKGDPASGQVLVYNQGENNFQFQDQQAGGAGGDDLIDSAIEVTNTDGAFSAIKGSTFETGTSITSVLSQILNPYSYSTLSISSFAATIDGSSQSVSSDKVVEVGNTVVLASLTYTVTNGSQIKDDSLTLLKDGAVNATNLPESDSTYSLSSITESKSAPGEVSFSLRATDAGSVNSAEKEVVSPEFKFLWRYSTRLSAGSTIPSSNGQATVLYQASVDAKQVLDPGTGSIDLDCNAQNLNTDNFTFLMIPESFGTLKSVILNNSTDVTADFVQVTSSTFTVTNDHGIGVSYYIYRTNDPGAFSDSSTLTIKFN